MPSILYESQEESAYSYRSVYGPRWYGQTFTSDTSHVIESVDLRLTRAGSLTGAGIFHVEIYAVDGSHKPTGAVRATGNFTKDEIDTTSSGDWFNVPLSGASPNITADIEYAIVLRADDGAGDVESRVKWMVENANIYAGGLQLNSSNSGSSWITNSSYDLTFREYGLSWDISGAATAEATMTGQVFIVPAFISGTFSATAEITGTADTKERFVPARRGDYDPDTFWDEETKTWLNSRPLSKMGGGRHKTYLVVVSDRNLVYVGGL